MNKSQRSTRLSRISLLIVTMLVTTGIIGGCSSGGDNAADSDAVDEESSAAASEIEDARSTTFTGDTNSEFCVLTRDILESMPNDSVEGLRGFVDNAQATQDRWIETAPEELSSDVEVFIAQLEPLGDALNADDFDSNDLGDPESEFNQLLQEPEFRVAVERISKYMTDVCRPEMPEREGEVPADGGVVDGSDPDTAFEDAPEQPGTNTDSEPNDGVDGDTGGPVTESEGMAGE